VAKVSARGMPRPVPTGRRFIPLGEVVGQGRTHRVARSFVRTRLPNNQCHPERIQQMQDLLELGAAMTELDLRKP
jgi:hypothetical protein